MSKTPSHCLYVPPSADPILDFDGRPAILDMGFHMTEAEYLAFRDMPWPEPNDETIVPADFGNENSE